MDQSYGEVLFNYLYGNVDGYSVSHDARKDYADQEKVKELLYGEVPFLSLKEIIEKSAPKKDGVFFDLGSGTGRVVIASQLLFNFKKSVGVELLKGLYDKSCEVKKKFDEEVKQQIPNYAEERKVEFVNADILSIDLREADVIFMNHPFKDRELFAKLEEKFINELKPGTKIVTIIRKLDNPKIKFVDSKKYNFSWGESTAHFHEI